MHLDSETHEPRTNAEHSETGRDFRVSYESESVVYFIEAENGLVKIGFATDFDDRFRRLVCGSPVALDVLALARGDRGLEREYHARFKRWRRHGEWFESSPDLAEEIERLNDEWPVSRRMFATVL